MQTVSVNGREMEYIHFGKEGGEAFVLLPGLSLKSVCGSAEAIISAYSLISADFEVFLFNHAKEEPEGYTIADMAADTLAAFDYLGIEKARIMGVSMGGMVAQMIALEAPERVKRLVLCSTAPKVGDTAVLDLWRDLAEKKDAKGLSKAFGEYVYTPSFYKEYKDVIDNLGEGASNLDFANFIISVDAIKSFDVTERVSGLDCPVLVIGAGEDRVLGIQGSCDLMEAAPGCRGYVFEGRGHGVYDEVPDYLQRIYEFVK